MDMFSATLSRISKGDSFKEIMDLKNEINKLVYKEKYQTARDKCEELASEIRLLPDDSRKTKSALLRQTNQIIYLIRGEHIPENEIHLGTYVDAEIKFKCLIAETSAGIRQGDSGFEITNDYGYVYNCYAKKMPDLKVGDKAKLWITNINYNKKIIYLEPRVERGDIILAKIKKFSSRGELFFRFLSYDGFVKKDFSGFKLAEPNNFYKMRAEYSRLAVGYIDDKIFRVGILFANPLEKISKIEYDNLGGKILV